MDFLLDCFVLCDDEERVFPVKIDNVGILKDEIEKENAPHFDNVAKAISLYKGSLKVPFIVPVSTWRSLYLLIFYNTGTGLSCNLIFPNELLPTTAIQTKHRMKMVANVLL